MSEDEPTPDDVVEVPITEEFDLHSFDPRDIPALVGEYLDRCHDKGFRSVRVIHGRGRGVQRAVVRRALAARSDIESFEDAPPGLGGWGATLVRLRY